MKSKQKRATKILELLDEKYFHLIDSELYLVNCSTSFQFLIAVILSAQSTDKQVNSVTHNLFSQYPDPKSIVNAPFDEIAKIISSVGLYKRKTKYIKEMSKMILSEYNGKVPTDLKELIKLPGVGRKTANVVLNDWYKIHQGIAVDTHVKRLVFRMGLTKEKNPNMIERDLKPLFPKNRWGHVNRLLIAHGRAICTAQSPKCEQCFLTELCPKNGINT